MNFRNKPGGLPWEAYFGNKVVYMRENVPCFRLNFDIYPSFPLNNIFERIGCCQLTQYIEANLFLAECLHGFRQRKKRESIEIAFQNITEHIHKATNDKKFVLMFIDLLQAFSATDHNNLLCLNSLEFLRHNLSGLAASLELCNKLFLSVKLLQISKRLAIEYVIRGRY